MTQQQQQKRTNGQSIIYKTLCRIYNFVHWQPFPFHIILQSLQLNLKLG